MSITTKGVKCHNDGMSNYMHINTASEKEFTEKAVEVLLGQIEKCRRDGSTELTMTRRHFSEVPQHSCTIGLSGGSTPHPVYEALGKAKLPWKNIHFFLVDERYVPADNPDSTQHMIRETLLKHAHVPEENLVFPDTSLPLRTCIAGYKKAFLNLCKNHPPDICILGLGPDGHITSLFPPLTAAALDPKKTVIHTTTDIFAVHDRILLTLPTLAQAKKFIFLLKGEEKRAAWKMMLESKEDERRWPAKYILERGEVTVVSLW